jgi:aminocarboxymuconate-semialdehyde decarboxylase
MPARFYVDSLVHDADALALLLKLFGAERIAFGSDYPFSLGETHPGKLIESMKLSEKERAQLFAGTVREFLGLVL